MKSIIKLMLIAVPLLTISEQTWALRCGNKIVSVGDKKYKVLARCGEPDYSEIRERRIPSFCYDGTGYGDTYNSNGYYRNYRDQRAYSRIPCRYETIEVWIYNFGPNKFVKELIFRKGKVFDINSLEYGD